MSAALRSRGRTRPRFAPVLTLLVALAGGCLEFDAQDVFVHHDRVHDRLDLMLVYRGLHSTVEGDHNGFEEGVEQLDRALEHGRFAFWNSWPFGLDPTQDQSPEARKFLDHIQVENGGLFRDEQGRLCGYQYIRLDGVKALVQKINAAFSVLIAEENLEQGRLILAGRHRMDGETVDRLADSLRSGNPLLRLRGAALEFGFPCSDADHAKVRAALFDELLNGVAGDLTRGASPMRGIVPERMKRELDLTDRDAVQRALAGSSALRLLRDNEIGLVREGPVTRVVFGVPGKDTAVFRKAPDGLYRPDLLQFLVERKTPPIDGVITEATLLERFAAFRRRAPNPPPVASRPQALSKPAR